MTQPESMRTRAYTYGVERLNGNDAWALFVSCAAGDMTRAKALLAKDPRLVNAQFWYQFPIHNAVRAGNAELVKTLLKHGADPGKSRFTYDSWDRLLAAAEIRGYHKIVTLLERAMKQRFRYSPDFGELRNAIVSRNPRSISAVVRRKPHLARAADGLGNNGIHWAVITRQRQLIDRFLDLGAPIDAQRADGRTPALVVAHEAYDYWYRGARGRRHPSIRNSWVMLGHLLARGAKYSISLASASGDQERVEQLLKKDISLAKRLDSSRISPLSYAAREGYTHIVELLLEHGADPNMAEDLAPQGRALFEACGGNHLDCADVLLRCGADPNAGVDSCGCCLSIVKYHHAKDCKPLQSLLRQYGAYAPPYEMSAKDMKQALSDQHDVVNDEEFLGCVMGKNDGSLLDAYLKADPSMPKRLQAYGGITYPPSVTLIRRLLAAGLDPNRPDWLGRTFLHKCAETGDTKSAAVFLEAGADLNARDVEFKGTPLAAAVRHNPRRSEEDHAKEERQRLSMVKFLLKRGAATNLTGDEVWATPLAWARKCGFLQIESILLQHGASG